MKKNTIALIAKNLCTGCGACVNICPAGAIAMKLDTNGFLYPDVDNGSCVECGACYEHCPAASVAKPEKKQNRDVFATQASKDIQMISSSGGTFSVIAEYVLEKGGRVFGAAWNDDFSGVRHISVSNKNDLEKIRKSKYLQSDTEKTFSEVKVCLENGEYVFYTGCSCQIDGLYSYLKRDYNGLITADLVCHGVPSQKLFQKYLAEISAGKKLERLDFRCKEKFGWGTACSAFFTDGTTYHKNCDNDPYFKAFKNGISIRENCGECKYAGIDNRAGDFTLGDFWGISEIDESFKGSKGISFLSINTEKAKQIFAKLRDRFEVCKTVSREDTERISARHNGQMLGSPRIHRERNRFFELAQTKSFSEALDTTMNGVYDVGVIGWWYNKNYGGTLTYYALHQALKKMGLSVLMIEESFNNADFKPDYNSIPRRFARKYYNISENIHKNRLGLLNERCGAFVSGSDQLFSPYLWEFSGPPYYLDFVNPKKNIISYASSFGESYSGPLGDSEDFRIKISYYLRRFNALSVREDFAVDIMRDVFGLEAQQVLDPVFICDPAEYDKLADKSSIKPEAPYFASFFLDPDDGKRDLIKHLNKQLKRPYVNLIHAMEFETNMRLLDLDNTKPDLDIEDFLAYYKNADFIITDSFHGTCFAIIFRKPFISIANKKRGVRRFESLLNAFGLSHRLIYEYGEIYERPELLGAIDYGEVYKIVQPLREQSYRWLENAVKRPRSKAKDEFNVLDAKMYDLVLKNLKLQEIIYEQRKEIEKLKNNM